MNYRIIRHIKEAFAIGLLLCISNACSSDADIPSNTGDPFQTAVQLATTREQASADGTGDKTPPNGTYYLGYKTGEAQKIQAIELKDGIIEAEEGTGLYWANMTKEGTEKANFTLSNVEDAESIVRGYDILWNAQSDWMKALSFKLVHTMAQVKVTLEKKEDFESGIASVTLTAIRQGISFNRLTGETKADAQAATVLELKQSGNKSGENDLEWSAILPPQARADEMELKVTTADNKTYKRKLPYSMLQGSDNNWESIVLAFRSGYTLNLTATLTEEIDYTIYFTGATLQNWNYKGSYPVVAKPAGIYTATELNKWAIAYNAYKEDGSKKNREALLKYGILTESAWTFTIQRNISATKDKITQVSNFSDNFKTTNSYKITGIKQSDLFTGNTTGTIGDDIFDKETE